MYTRIRSIRIRFDSKHDRSAWLVASSLHRDITFGTFRDSLFARDFRATACAPHYEERTLGALLSFFGLIYGPVKEEEIVFARALRGLAATFLRFAPIVCPRGMSAANFRPHLKARSGEKTISTFFLLCKRR